MSRENDWALLQHEVTPRWESNSSVQCSVFSDMILGPLPTNWIFLSKESLLSLDARCWGEKEATQMSAATLNLQIIGGLGAVLIQRGHCLLLASKKLLIFSSHHD